VVQRLDGAEARWCRGSMVQRLDGAEARAAEKD